MLTVENIHKSYGSLHVLKGIDLSIAEAQVSSIVGPSGAGKSTLLHLMGTLDKPDKGNIYIDGTNLHQLSDDRLAAFRNKHIGFVFQFHNLLPEFTALENICLPGYIAKAQSQQVHKRAEELLQLLGIAGRAHHKPSALSGGEQQRAAVARALINSPSIIFADEPSGNLDSRNAEELHNLFFKLRDELGQTFVIVTHNFALAEMADRKITLVDGAIASDEYRVPHFLDSSNDLMP